jgi:hypothetical protein
MNWLERIMVLSIGFFIIVTGIVLEINNRWITSIYIISIMLLSILFVERSKQKIRKSITR